MAVLTRPVHGPYTSLLATWGLAQAVGCALRSCREAGSDHRGWFPSCADRGLGPEQRQRLCSARSRPAVCGFAVRAGEAARGPDRKLRGGPV